MRIPELLVQWSVLAFPFSENGRRSPEQIAALNFLWQELADALCGSQMSAKGHFFVEMHRLDEAGHGGEPPVQALADRLEALTNYGLREFFLAVAVSEAVGRLIGVRFPSKVAQWQEMADERMPPRLQFSVTEHESPSSSGPTQYGYPS